MSQRGKARLHQPSPQLGVATLDDSAGSWVNLRPLRLRLPGLAGHLLSSGPFSASSEWCLGSIVCVCVWGGYPHLGFLELSILART